MMAKTVALADPAAKLAGYLAAKGYKVVGLQEAGRLRAHVDAILYTGYRQESAEFAAGLAESAFVNSWPAVDDLPGAIVLNVTGLNPDQAAAELELRLHRRDMRW